MQFEYAYALLFLIAIPGLALIYAKYTTRRKDTILQFSSLDVVAKAAGRRGRARLHLPFLILIAAACMATVALADPQIPVTQAEPADALPNGRNISIVLDVSESMTATDYAPSRLEAAKKSISRLIGSIGEHDYVGVVAFETGATTVSYLTHDAQSAADAIMAINRTGGATAIGDGLALGIDMATSIPGRDGVVILLSDGVHNSGRIMPKEAAEYARAAGVRVHTVGIGSPEPAYIRDDVFGNPQYANLDEETLRAIANATGGSYSKSLDAGALDAILVRITEHLQYDMEHESIGHWFGASTLMLIAAALYVMYGRYRIVA